MVNNTNRINLYINITIE